MCNTINGLVVFFGFDDEACKNGVNSIHTQKNLTNSLNLLLLFTNTNEIASFTNPPLEYIFENNLHTVGC